MLLAQVSTRKVLSMQTHNASRLGGLNRCWCCIVLVEYDSSSAKLKSVGKKCLIALYLIQMSNRFTTFENRKGFLSAVWIVLRWIPVSILIIFWDSIDLTFARDTMVLCQFSNGEARTTLANSATKRKLLSFKLLLIQSVQRQNFFLQQTNTYLHKVKNGHPFL